MRLFWPLIIAASAICLYLMRGAYIGDPVIYLAYAQNLASGGGFPVLNLGEFSSGLTSPLWGLITTACFLFPQPQEAAHYLGVITLLVAIWIGRRSLPKNELSDIGLALMFALAVINSIYFYETPLMLCVCFLSSPASRGLSDSCRGFAPRESLFRSLTPSTRIATSLSGD